jgi:hypothetical protein
MKMTHLRSFDNYFLANITLTKLEHHGIACFLKDEHTVTMDPILGNAIGGIKLLVNEEEAKEAVELLSRFDKEYLESVVCPNCGKNEISSVAKQGATNFITAILTWIFSNYAVAPESVYICGHCRYESKTLPVSLTDDDVVTPEKTL